VNSARLPVRVLVVGDHTLFREGVAGMCAAEEDVLKVVGQARADDSAVAAVEQDKPHVVLLDVGPGQTNPEHLVHRLTLATPTPRVVVLTSHEDPGLIRKAVHAGARAYVLKSATRAELLAVMRAVGEGEDNVLVSVSRATLDNLHARQGSPLSARELEVISLIAEGMTNAQVAAGLYISKATVKRHLTNIYAKLDVSSRIQAINKAAAMGLLEHDIPAVPLNVKHPA
jgi:DNA-binding NarL/FixJ family response regulator